MTDLVGSTAMADRLGPHASEELRREHFRLLREALARSDGTEVKSLGDGLMVVFANASSAVSCAIEMQQRTEAHNRRADERLEVRIGVAFGESTVDGGDYYGAPPVESARLCAHAEGGQILTTDLVRQVARTREQGVFVALGGLQLKGISEPVEACELRWDPIHAADISLPAPMQRMRAGGFVGRAAERAWLTEMWDEAREGSLRVALICAEAGMGKTRLSAQIGLEAHERGAVVLYGRCDEDLGIPYLPWTQALGHYVREAPAALLESYVERNGDDLSRLLPALGERLPRAVPRSPGDPETDRYLLYGAVAGLLEAAGEAGPLLLILDDLHWADTSTLSLLRHVATRATAIPALIVGTYRDTDLGRDHPLGALSADLAREQHARRLQLTGLPAEDLLTLMQASTGQSLGEDGRALAHQLALETAGNPFFAGELLRHLRESGSVVEDTRGNWRVVGEVSKLGLPQSVREVIGRRVRRLSAETLTVLSAAAVAGRECEIDLLAEVVELPESRVLDRLEEAVTASLLTESAERAGRFAFVHALVEYTLYEDLGRTRRALLHRRTAEAIESKYGDQIDERLGELASHWVEAVVGEDAKRAVGYSRRAAQRALDQLAPEEAVRWFEQALELFEGMRGRDLSERCELLLGLGEAQRQVGDPAFRQTLLDAVALARQLSDIDRLCRGAMANNRGWASNFGGVDAERVQSLERAASALPDSDPRRAQVLALLACELQFADEPEHCASVAAEAIAIARAAGDRSALAHTIANAGWSMVVPHTLAERKRLMEELGTLVTDMGDARLSARSAVSLMMVGLEVGDHGLAERSLHAIRDIAAGVPEPFIGYLRRLLDFGWALLHGDLASAESSAMGAYEVGNTAGQPDAGIFLGAHLFHIRYFQGRAGGLVEQVIGLAGDQANLSGWRAGAAALALIQSGRTEEARELVLGEDLQALPLDEAWSIVMMLWADACSRLGVVDRANELYDLLAPFSGQMSVSGSHVYGSFDWALGALAASGGRGVELAERHFSAAAEIETALQAPLLLARTHARWAGALIADGSPEGVRRAGSLLAEADEAAGRLGAEGIAGEVRELREGERAAAL
jgi:tetratricopeptide (TPR) repeat protein